MRCTQRGFSLVEMLVALVVFSVGLLAIAGLQTMSKQANFEALQRTTASHIAFGLLEDMRNNGGSITSYVTSGSLGGGSRGTLFGRAICARRATVDTWHGAAGADCSAEERAAFDLWFWENYADGSLELNDQGAVGGVLTPTICINGPFDGSAGIYTVTVAWRGTVSLGNAAANGCGTGSGNYGDNNEFRRLVAMPTFLDPRI